MRLGLLGCAAALTSIGAAAAQAETIYLTETDIAPAPGYVYAAPAPIHVRRAALCRNRAGPGGDRGAALAYVLAPREQVIEREPW